MPALSLTPVSDEDGSREFDIPEESCEETVSDLLSLKSVLGTLTKEEPHAHLPALFQEQNPK